MKSEPKAFASLSSGLLARKGAARPAMRPQGFGQSGGSLEDLGWNDMGFEAPKPAAGSPRDESHDAFGDEIVAGPSRNPLAALTPVQSPVHSQQAELVERLVGTDEGEPEEVDETAEIYEPGALSPLPLEAEPEVPFAFVPEPAAAPEAAPAVAPKVVRPRAAPKSRAAAGSKAKAAFTLRVDPARHLKLRLACAVSGRSAQQIVTDALDSLLGAMPELDAMAAKANRKG